MVQVVFTGIESKTLPKITQHRKTWNDILSKLVVHSTFPHHARWVMQKIQQQQSTLTILLVCRLEIQFSHLSQFPNILLYPTPLFNSMDKQSMDSMHNLVSKTYVLTEDRTGPHELGWLRMHVIKTDSISSITEFSVLPPPLESKQKCSQRKTVSQADWTHQTVTATKAMFSTKNKSTGFKF